MCYAISHELVNLGNIISQYSYTVGEGQRPEFIFQDYKAGQWQNQNLHFTLPCAKSMILKLEQKFYFRNREKGPE